MVMMTMMAMMTMMMMAIFRRAVILILGTALLSMMLAHGGGQNVVPLDSAGEMAWDDADLDLELNHFAKESSAKDSFSAGADFEAGARYSASKRFASSTFAAGGSFSETSFEESFEVSFEDGSIEQDTQVDHTNGDDTNKVDGHLGSNIVRDSDPVDQKAEPYLSKTQDSFGFFTMTMTYFDTLTMLTYSIPLFGMSLIEAAATMCEKNEKAYHQKCGERMTELLRTTATVTLSETARNASTASSRDSNTGEWSIHSLTKIFDRSSEYGGGAICVLGENIDAGTYVTLAFMRHSQIPVKIFLDTIDEEDRREALRKLHGQMTEICDKCTENIHFFGGDPVKIAEAYYDAASSDEEMPCAGILGVGGKGASDMMEALAGVIRKHATSERLHNMRVALVSPLDAVKQDDSSSGNIVWLASQDYPLSALVKEDLKVHEMLQTKPAHRERIVRRDKAVADPSTGLGTVKIGWLRGVEEEGVRYAEPGKTFSSSHDLRPNALIVITYTSYRYSNRAYGLQDALSRLSYFNTMVRESLTASDVIKINKRLQDDKSLIGALQIIVGTDKPSFIMPHYMVVYEESSSIDQEFTGYRDHVLRNAQAIFTLEHAGSIPTYTGEALFDGLSATIPHYLKGQKSYPHDFNTNASYCLQMSDAHRYDEACEVQLRYSHAKGFPNDIYEADLFYQEREDDFTGLVLDRMTVGSRIIKYSPATKHASQQIDELIYFASIGKCVVSAQSLVAPEVMTVFGSVFEFEATEESADALATVLQSDMSRRRACQLRAGEYYESLLQNGSVLGHVVDEAFDKIMKQGAHVSTQLCTQTSVMYPSCTRYGAMANLMARTATGKMEHAYYLFFPHYLEHFRSLRGGAMLELGVQYTNSIKMWLQYFPHGFYYGADISFETRGERVEVFKCDQDSTADVMALVDKIKHPVFFINDDASHAPRHQIESFNILFDKLLMPGGIYIIEDIETSYWGELGNGNLYGFRFAAGYRVQNTLIEVFKSLVDDVNSRFMSSKTSEAQSNLLNEHFSPKTRDDILSITFASNCVIVRKKSAEDHDILRGLDNHFNSILG